MTTYSTKEAAALIGVSYDTLRGWHRRGQIAPVLRRARPPHERVYTEEDIERIRAWKNELTLEAVT